MTTHNPEPHIGSSSLSPPSFSRIPFPRALRHNRSFAQLVRFIGLAPDDKADFADTDSDVDEIDDEDGTAVDSNGFDDEDVNDANSDDVDEESLMWDAQTALISHQPSLAMKYYSTAALPPYRSSAACLALGNLLVRGSALQQSDDLSPSSSRKGSIISNEASLPTSPPPSQSWFSLFRNPATAQAAISQYPAEQTPPLISNGWALPTDGKRAVRDVEGMGKAGGWFILGLGWIIDNELEHAHKYLPVNKQSQTDPDEDESTIIISKNNKGKNPIRREQNAELQSPRGTTCRRSPSTSTADSFIVQTPEEDDDGLSAAKKIKLMYELLSPLLNLYRHGHIQKLDPVALPPISNSQLPTCLRRLGDDEKGRNTWALGSAVASRLLKLDILNAPLDVNRDTDMKRKAVLVIGHYIRGITSTASAEDEFKAVLDQGPCGLPTVDNLLQQAYRRLSLVAKANGGEAMSPEEVDNYPYPLVSANERNRMKQHGRKKSVTSIFSFADGTHTSKMLQTPCKSTASLASLSHEAPVIDQPSEVNGAMSSLRNVKRAQDKVQRRVEARRNAANAAWWPSLNNWTISTPPAPPPPSSRPESRPETSAVTKPKELENPAMSKERPTLRAVASSPHLGATAMANPPEPRKLPFEPQEQIARIDPELAALELASALTKKVACSVCGAGGVNFPNCRKCGLTFCSRDCRINETGAGNGKRHICGAWESRQLLKPPEVRPNMTRRASHSLSPLTVSAAAAAVH